MMHPQIKDIDDMLSFDQLYKAYYCSLLKIVKRKITDHDVAQDVLQDAFVKIWQSLDFYDVNKGGIYPWMARICLNLAIDKVRSRDFRNHQITDELGKASVAVDLKQWSVLNTDATDVFQQLNHLNDNYVDVIMLSYNLGYTHVEIADKLHLPLGTVKSRIRTGMKLLRKRWL